MGEREICIELVGQGEPSRKAIRDFWASQIGNRLKEEVPSKKERLEILVSKQKGGAGCIQSRPCFRNVVCMPDKNRNYRNSDTAQYTRSRAITRFTAFVCRAKNRQKAAPNRAHT